MVARLVQGIGDIYWILQKIIDKDIDIEICSSPPLRGMQVFDVVEHNFRSVKYTDKPICTEVYTTAKYNLRWAEVKDMPIVNISANRWLDAGNRIEAWMPDEPIKKIKFKLGDPFVDEDTVVIYTSSMSNVAHKKKDIWRGEHWIEFIRQFDKDQKFHIIGAEYDRDLVEFIFYNTKFRCKMEYSIDKPLADVLASIKKGRCFLSRASGLGILGEAVGANVYMQYPRYETLLMNAWPRQESLSNGKYIATTGKITAKQLKEIVEQWH